MNKEELTTTEVLHNNLPYIEYTSEQGVRKIAILDGQPYYCSTGFNSKTKDTWFPFVMLKGNIILEEKDQFQPVAGLNEDNLREILFSTNVNANTYIIKRNKDILSEENIDIDIKSINEILYSELNKAEKVEKESIYNRFATKKDILNSMHLGGGIWNIESIKNKILKKINLSEGDVGNSYQLAEKSQIATDDPNTINRWLLENGGKDINELYNKNNNLFGFLKTLHEICKKLSFYNEDRKFGFWANFQYEGEEIYKELFDILNRFKNYISDLINHELTSSCKSMLEVEKMPLGNLVNGAVLKLEEDVYRGSSESNGLTLKNADEIKVNEISQYLEKTIEKINQVLESTKNLHL